MFLGDILCRWPLYSAHQVLEDRVTDEASAQWLWVVTGRGQRPAPGSSLHFPSRTRRTTSQAKQMEEALIAL